MPIFLSGGVPIHMQQAEPATGKKSPAILLLHGSGGDVAYWFAMFAPTLSRLGVARYAVHYFDRTGTKRADTTTIMDGHHVPLWLSTVSDSLGYIAERPRIDPDRVAVLGVSLGAFLALAMAATSNKVRAVVEISGGLAEPYASRATGSFPPTLILHGEEDTVVPASEATELNARLNRLGVAHQMQLLPGEGHWFSAGAQVRILAAVAAFLGLYL